MAKKISIVIVSYNVCRLLDECLQSVQRALEGIEGEVFVVDNNSTDGSVQYLKDNFPKEAFPQLHIIANSDNPGFGKANNQAFRMAKGDYVLYCNPDTFVSEDTLHRCLDFMNGHPDAGCMGVKMLNAKLAISPSTAKYRFLSATIVITEKMSARVSVMVLRLLKNVSNPNTIRLTFTFPPCRNSNYNFR